MTKLQYEVGRELTMRGHSVYWITTDPAWTGWLKARDVDSSFILCLSEALAKSPVDHCLKREKRFLQEVERTSNYSATAAHLADRFLNSKREATYLGRIATLLYAIDCFVEQKGIRVIFGELTNLNEQLTAMLACYRTDLKFLNPQDMRLPSNRFLIENSIKSGELLGESSCSADEARNFLDDFRKNGSQPRYFGLWNSRTLTTERPLKALISHIIGSNAARRNLLTSHRLSERVRTNLQRAFIGRYLDQFFRYDKLTRGMRYAYFPLHVQPEASIDVKGRFFNDQIKLIRDIRKSLVSDIPLVVKDHPNFLGQKGLLFYRRVREIPGVLLVHPHMKNSDLIQSAEIVFTVSGTAAYEAGMLGRQAIMFSNQFFSDMPSISVCSDVTKLKIQIDLALSRSEPDVDAVAESLVPFFRKSFPGIWADPQFDGQVMAAGNINALANGFELALRAVKDI